MCERERERMRKVEERERVCVCVCVCVREREREKGHNHFSQLDTATLHELYPFYDAGSKLLSYVPYTMLPRNW